MSVHPHGRFRPIDTLGDSVAARLRPSGTQSVVAGASAYRLPVASCAVPDVVHDTMRPRLRPLPHARRVSLRAPDHRPTHNR
jgi:hypothetical protein